MFEGKEAEGKIGEIGSYSVDVTPDIKVDAAVDVGFEKDLIASIPGGLTVKLKLSAEIDADPVAIALMELAKSTNPVMKFLGDQLAKLRAGEPPHPAVTQAADEAAKASEAAASAAAAPAAPQN